MLLCHLLSEWNALQSAVIVALKFCIALFLGRLGVSRYIRRARAGGASEPRVAAVGCTAAPGVASQLPIESPDERLVASPRYQRPQEFEYVECIGACPCSTWLNELITSPGFPRITCLTAFVALATADRMESAGVIEALHVAGRHAQIGRASCR